MNEAVCPVSCGVCCEYWGDVEELRRIRDSSYPEECPHMGTNGCSLPREQRPSACREHLCLLGQAALEALLTPDEVEYFLRQGGETQQLHDLVRVRRGLTKKGWRLYDDARRTG